MRISHFILVSALSCLSASIAWSAEEGLVAHWSFNEGSGPTVRDLTGNGNDGAVHGAKFVKNKGGFCLEFDGESAYMDCGSGPTLDLRKTVSVEAWVMPIGLGIVRQADQPDIARTIMKAVVTYLRHGMVYYHYSIDDIPEAGVGRGEYGPVNHSFPLTIVNLHEGWIEAKERIITCVSGVYNWPKTSPPRILLFDLTGKGIPNRAEATREGEGWRVDLKLRDWAEIAVLE